MGSLGEELTGKRVVLCITGSVAAYECPRMARDLMKHGAEVYAVMSAKAQELIHKNLMEWATGNPVIAELTGRLEHIALVGKHEGKADVILISPATANTIGKLAHGIDDTPVTSIALTALGSRIPILIAPAMHESLYDNPIVLENIKSLEGMGVEFIGPRMEEGKAKIASVDDIVEAVIRRLSLKDLWGLRVLITAGPTVERIDPIRILSNRSSGKMGMSMAREALRRGADVTLVYGKGSVPPPQGATNIEVETTGEMHEKIISLLKAQGFDVLIATSATADFSPEKGFDEKVQSRRVGELILKLKALPKVIDKAKRVCPELFLVAFKAEYKASDEQLISKAHELMEASGADLVIANDVGREGSGFGSDENEVYITNRVKENIHIPLSLKQAVAKRVWDIILKEYRAK